MRAGELPRVTVLEIIARDKDGGLIAEPVAWDEFADGTAPAVAIRAPTGDKPWSPGSATVSSPASSEQEMARRPIRRE